MSIDFTGKRYTKAYAAIFRLIGKLGIETILSMTEEEFEKHFPTLDYDTPEIPSIIAELRFLRNPMMDIESIHQEIQKNVDVHWLSITPGEMFTPRFMSGMQGSAYFDTCDQFACTLGQVVKSWFIDLRHGLYLSSRNNTVSCFSNHHANTGGEEFATYLAKVILDNDLVEEFQAIPHAMIIRADLWETKCYLTKMIR